MVFLCSYHRMEESYDLLIDNGLLLVSPLATQAIVLHHVETANLNPSGRLLIGAEILLCRGYRRIRKQCRSRNIIMTFGSVFKIPITIRLTWLPKGDYSRNGKLSA